MFVAFPASSGILLGLLIFMCVVGVLAALVHVADNSAPVNRMQHGQRTERQDVQDEDQR